MNGRTIKLILLSACLLFMLGCAISQAPAVKPTQEMAVEPEVGQEQGVTPEEAQLPPASHTSVTCEGYFAVETVYPPPESASCNLFPPGASGCSDTLNPCPQSGGGGGGGGGGDVACLRMADFCYECMPDYGATMFYTLAEPGGGSYMDNVRFVFQVDADGFVTSFEWSEGVFGIGWNAIQTGFSGGPGEFQASYTVANPNVSLDKTPGYVNVVGTGITATVTDYGTVDQHVYEVTEATGSGTWELGHPVFGNTATGSWNIHLRGQPFYFCTVNP